jgi:hypothetical protein
MAIEEVVTASRSPWQNAYVQRVIGSIRRECLDHVIVFDERHLRRVLSAYFRYHHPAGRISRLPRIVQNLGPYSRRLQAPLLPSHRSAVCTIATSVAPRKLFAVRKPAQPSRRRGSSRPAVASCECHSAPNRCLVSGRSSGQRFARMIKKPLPHASSANRFHGLLNF